MTAYPTDARARDRWIVAQRPARHAVDPGRPYAFLVEQERAESGEVVPVATLFLTNRECPWRCLMCDLWKNTLPETVPSGAIPAQIDHALSELRGHRREGYAFSAGMAPHPDEPNPLTPSFSPTGGEGWGEGAVHGEGHPTAGSPAHLQSSRLSSPLPSPPSEGGEGEESGAPNTNPTAPGNESRAATPRQVKLYNSGSFFDPRAIPVADYSAIAERVRAFERVIVECHPALVNDRVLRFRDLLAGKLEVAMGLETAHPQVLAKLNKGMTLEQFARAADYLRRNEIALRVFILVKPPFLGEAEALLWAGRSLDFAFDCSATVASLIPTRPGNGALEALAEDGSFSPPRLATLEAAMDYGIGLQRGRVFADLWDLEKFSSCAGCFEARRGRLQALNLTQSARPAVFCARCAGPA